MDSGATGKSDFMNASRDQIALALAEIALATEAPVLIAPAMNGKMWKHPATQANVALLQSRGVHFIGPEKGLLACGYEGLGRLWNVDEIIERAVGLLG